MYLRTKWRWRERREFVVLRGPTATPRGPLSLFREFATTQRSEHCVVRVLVRVSRIPFDTIRRLQLHYALDSNFAGTMLSSFDVANHVLFNCGTYGMNVLLGGAGACVFSFMSNRSIFHCLYLTLTALFCLYQRRQRTAYAIVVFRCGRYKLLRGAPRSTKEKTPPNHHRDNDHLE